MEQCKKALTRLMAKADPLDVNLNVFIEAVAKAERARVPTQDITKAKARLAEVKVAHDENDQKLRGKDVWMVASSVDRNGTAMKLREPKVITALDRPIGLHLQAVRWEGADLRCKDYIDDPENPRAPPKMSTSGAHFEGVDMVAARLSDARLDGAFLTDANLEQAHLEKSQLLKADIKRSCFSGCKMSKACLRDCDASNAVFSRAVLCEADLGRGLFGFANFSNCDLRGADLREADLRGANFFMADLTDAALDGADLSNTRFLGAKLDNAKLGSIKLDGILAERADEMVLAKLALNLSAAGSKSQWSIDTCILEAMHQPPGTPGRPSSPPLREIARPMTVPWGVRYRRSAEPATSTTGSDAWRPMSVSSPFGR